LLAHDSCNKQHYEQACVQYSGLASANTRASAAQSQQARGAHRALFCSPMICATNSSVSRYADSALGLLQQTQELRPSTVTTAKKCEQHSGFALGDTRASAQHSHTVGNRRTERRCIGVSGVGGATRQPS
jgi:hypothetical protein